MALAPHGIEAAWRYLQETVETHGWRILGLSVLFFVLRKRYSAYATRAHVQRTLREANGAWQLVNGNDPARAVDERNVAVDPERVAVLRREAARVREQQQQQLQETLPARKKKSKPQ